MSQLGRPGSMPVRIRPWIASSVFLLTLATGAGATNRYPPGPSYRSCPDTLRIYDIQQPDTLVAPCHPASTDTVLGITGIVTGFDAKASGFAVFFQNSQGGPYSGLEAFTGATNYKSSPYNLALGDSIAVYGITQEFPLLNGTTEIDGPDGIQSTNDIVIRKISSGNPLPPTKLLTTHDINYIPGSETPPRQEQWEDCLVRVNGPLKVARTSLQGGLPTNSFMVVTATSPFDSVLIDGNSLTTFAPPPVSTNVDWVQGIVSQNTSNSVNSYRIQLRDANDIAVSAPPNLTDAYPIDDTFSAPRPLDRSQVSLTSNETLRLVFDRNVDVPSAQNAGNYSLASGIDGSTVDAATVEGGSGNAVLLQITSVRVDGDLETVTASGIGSQTCPICLMSSQSRTFINGVLDIKTTQAPDPDSLAANPCQDRSRFAGPTATAGTRVSVRGVGTGIYGTLQYLEDPSGGLRSGLSVFGPSSALTRGHRFLIAGQIQEFGGETELVNSVYQRDEGVIPEPLPIAFPDTSVSTLTNAACDGNQSIVNGEDYEGVLVQIKNVMVAETRLTGQSFFVGSSSAGAGDTILVSNLNGVLNSYTPPDSGRIADVTGVLHFASGTFRICPRGASDITVSSVDVGSLPLGKVSFRAFPNPGVSVRLDFSLPRRDDVHLAVYDLRGRRIATIAEGRFEPGVYSKPWDGREATGRMARPGVYFYRLRVGREIFTLHGVLLGGR